MWRDDHDEMLGLNVPGLIGPGDQTGPTAYELLADLVDKPLVVADARRRIEALGIAPALTALTDDDGAGLATPNESEDHLARRLLGALAVTIDGIEAGTADARPMQAVLNYARGRVHGNRMIARAERAKEIASCVAALPDDFDPDRDVMCLFRPDEYEVFRLMAEHPEAIIGIVEGDWYSRIARTRAEAQTWPFDTDKPAPGGFSGGVVRKRVG